MRFISLNKTISIVLINCLLISCVSQIPAPIESSSTLNINDNIDYDNLDHDKFIVSGRIDLKKIPNKKIAKNKLGDLLNLDSDSDDAEGVQDGPKVGDVITLSNKKESLNSDENNVLNKKSSTNSNNYKERVYFSISEIVNNGKIITKFGNKNISGNVVKGIDIEAKLDEDIHSVCNGTVIFSGYDEQFGKLVIIKSDQDALFFAYAHMNNVIVKTHDKVSRGQVIGILGSTGNVTSPTLHFAIRKDNISVDPLLYTKQ